MACLSNFLRNTLNHPASFFFFFKDIKIMILFLLWVFCYCQNLDRFVSLQDVAFLVVSFLVFSLLVFSLLVFSLLVFSHLVFSLLVFIFLLPNKLFSLLYKLLWKRYFWVFFKTSLVLRIIRRLHKCEEIHLRERYICVFLLRPFFCVVHMKR